MNFRPRRFARAVEKNADSFKVFAQDVGWETWSCHILDYRAAGTLIYRLFPHAAGSSDGHNQGCDFSED